MPVLPYREAIVLAVGILMGIAFTRFLMTPIYCPRCGSYMASRAREIADWMLRRRKKPAPPDTP